MGSTDSTIAVRPPVHSPMLYGWRCAVAPHASLASLRATTSIESQRERAPVGSPGLLRPSVTVAWLTHDPRLESFRLSLHCRYAVRLPRPRLHGCDYICYLVAVLMPWRVAGSDHLETCVATLPEDLGQGVAALSMTR